MRLPVIGLILAVTVAIVVAIWTIGGPEQARAERRDLTRWQDLQALGRHLDCLLLDGRNVTDTSEACPNPPRRNDPFTDMAYLIDHVADRQFTLCAAFETDLSDTLRHMSALTFDSERGCVVIRRQMQR